MWNWLIFFLGEYSSVWCEICRVLSQIQWTFLLGISGKIHFGRIFQKFCANQSYPLQKLVKFHPTFCNFFPGCIALKKFTQVLSYVVCTQVRRHVHKQITERRYGEEKLGRFLFEKSVLFTLGLGLTAPNSFDILVWNFYQIFFIVSVEFWLRFEPQTRPTRFAINILFITVRYERKVRSCVKLFDFFPGWILIRLTWNLSRIVPNLVEILTQNFRKKTISRIALKKFTQVLSYLVCTQVRRHVHKQITERWYGEEKLGHLFSENRFCSLSVWDLLRLTPWVFWLKLLPDIRHCVYWVLADIWAPDSSHKIRNKFFIHHCPGWKEGSFVCEIVWFFFLGEYSSVWPEICRVLSQIQWRFLRGISGKKPFRENFSEILCKLRLSSNKTCEISPYFLQKNFGSVLRWKNSHKYFRMLFAPR